MTRYTPAVALLFVVGLLPSELAAQIRPLGSAGLGRSVTALDARARALGGSGVALHDDNLSALNPAGLIGLRSSGVWVTFMPEERRVKGQGVDDDISTATFPLGRLATPFSESLSAAVAFGGFLDQDWSVRFVDTLRTSVDDVPFQETRTSDGGIAQFRGELAYALSDKLALGLAGILYSGETRREVTRVFSVEQNFLQYQAVDALQHLGWGIAVGAEFAPTPSLILGAVGGWSPGLETRSDTTGASADFDLPITLDVGASWQAASELLLAANAGWAGWSAVHGAGPTVDAWRAGLGIEMRVLSGVSNALLLRVGGRYERTPFEIQGSAPTERSLSVGAGLSVDSGRARLDGTLQFGKRGNREDNGLEESYTRAILSLAIFAQ